MRIRIDRFNWLIALAAMLIIPANASAKIIYVDTGATGANDGSDWADAYVSLQDALSEAESAAKPIEIRVAQGLYRPDQGAEVTPGSREATFRLISGTTLKGGYAGVRESNSGRRDVLEYETILSGDLQDNDGNDVSSLGDNSRHVVTGNDTDAAAVLDGFTIEAGYADGYDGQYPFDNCGGGMYIRSGNCTITNCRFRRNTVVLYDHEYGGLGAAIYNIESNPSISNCTFTANSTDGWSGVLHNQKSSPTVRKCIFNDNDGSGISLYDKSNGTVEGCTFLRNKAGFGAGIICEYGSSPSVKDCIFVGNTAVLDGGALECYEDSHPNVTNCIFAGNKAKWQQGGGVCCLGSSPVVTNCTFAGNRANTGGGAVFCYRESNPRIVNCVLWDNTADRGPQIGLVYYDYPGYVEATTEITVSYCDIEGGPDEVYLEDANCLLHWNQGNIDADPCFAKAGYWDDMNTPEDADDDVWIDGDYHLKSQAGRWATLGGSWIQDGLTSPCIDAGDPMIPVGPEVFPNGGLINMGAYGGTLEASKAYFGSPTCEMIIAGDINGDCRVDFADFHLMALHWLWQE